MDKKDFVRKFVAGLFFIGTILLLTWVVLRIGSERGLTQPKFQMTVLYRTIGGLDQGAPVTLSGVNVGTVEDVDFVEPAIDGRSVKVVLLLYKRYENQLRHSIGFVIKTEGVLGEKIIDIVTDQAYYREDLAQPVIGEDPLDVQDLAKTFSDAAEAFSESSDNINSMMKELKRISATSTRLLNRIEQRIIDGNLFKVF